MNEVPNCESFQRVDPQWMNALGDIALPSDSWLRYTARMLVRLLGRAPGDPAQFPWAWAHWLRYQDQLNVLKVGAVDIEASGLTRRYPVVTALAAYDNRDREGGAPPLARLFAWVIFELHLRGQFLHAQAHLCEVLRGLSRRHLQNPLIDALGETGSLRELQGTMTQLGTGKPDDAPLTGHDSFDRLWRAELCAAVAAIDSQRNVVAREEPEHALATPMIASGDPDCDDGLEEAPLVLVPSIPMGSKVPKPRQLLALSVALATTRSSTAHIVRHPDNIVPASVARADWTRAHAYAQRCIDQGNFPAARRQLVLLLAIEAGLSEGEVAWLCFGSRSEGRWLALDVTGQRLLRAEMRPDQAYSPREADSGQWCQTGGDVVFPLTERTVSLATLLVEMRTDPVERRCLFVLLPGDQPEGMSVIGAALRESSPASNHSHVVFRRRIASHLSAKLGLDVAQMAFGDTFGEDATGTYYCRIRRSSITSCLADELARTTNEPVRLAMQTDMDGYIGSRAAPAGRPIAEQAEKFLIVRAPRPGRPNMTNLLGEWEARRDRLALHLSLATGHRPTRSLSLVSLDDFVPGHGLVILQDKRSDPAHMTRFASTGWSFTHELRDFLDFLGVIARNSSVPSASQTARAILTRRVPLFRTANADGAVSDLDVSDLFSRLPTPWCDKPNLHRHMLCQLLSEIGVDPELRYAQMGWLRGEEGGSGECAPYSPLEMTAYLAPHIDQCLNLMGWVSQTAAGPASIAIQADPVVDWSARIRKQARECRSRQVRLRAAYAARRAAALPAIQARIAEGIARFAPGLEVRSGHGRPELRATESPSSPADRPAISEGVVKQVLNSVVPGSAPSLESMLASSELARLLRVAVARRECLAFVPPSPRIHPFQKPGPFLLGAGKAVRDAEAIVHGLDKRLRSTTVSELRELGFSAWLAVLSHTPYRSVPLAREVVLGFKDAVRSSSEPGVMRVPICSGHACVSELPLLLLETLQREHRNADLGAVLDPNDFGAWLVSVLPDRLAPLRHGENPLTLLEETLKVAGRFQLSGIERALQADEISNVQVSAVRAASVADQCTLPAESDWTRQPEFCDEPLPEIEETQSPHVHGQVKETRYALGLLPLFSSDYVGSIAGEDAATGTRRRPQLIRAVADRRQKAGRRLTTDVLLLDYLMALLTDGRESDRAVLPGTIHTKAYRFSRRLLDLELGAWDLLDADEITSAMHVVLLQSARKIQRRVLAELRQFHRISALRHDIEAPDWCLLYKVAGERWQGSDPGVLGLHERRRVTLALRQATAPDEGRLMASPAEQRLRDLQRVAGALLDGSGCRPRSIYGLSLADLHFDDAGDFLLLKNRGRFGAQKTPTAAGFVPLEGMIWREEREWLRQWLARRCGLLEPAHLPRTPLFQQSGFDLGTRFPMRDVFNQLGTLIRWSTSHCQARTYWLRKARLQARHRKVQNMAFPKARDVVHVLRISGQVSIRTPLASYLHDPQTFMARGLRQVEPVSGPVLAQLTGVKQGTIAQRARRAGGSGISGAIRSGLLLALGTPMPSWLEASFDPGTAPEATYRATSSLCLLSDLMACMCAGHDAAGAAERCGIPVATADRVRAAMNLLEEWTSFRFGPGEARLSPPRMTSASRPLLNWLSDPPPELEALSRQWAERASRVPINAGCAFVDPSLEASLARLLESKSLGLLRRRVDGVDVVKPFHKQSSYGVWAALRWVLCVVWVGSERGNPRLVAASVGR